MPRDGAATKERILEKAEELVLGHGFAATTIDLVIEAVGITKGAFFYHFKNKAALAKGLVERYGKNDLQLFENFMSRAEKLSSDPLQQFLIFIGLFEEFARGFKEVPAGCLIASYCYERELFDEEIMNICIKNLSDLRELMADKIRDAIKKHPPRNPVDADSLADSCLAVIEGGFVLSKTYNDPAHFADQLSHFKNYVELLFAAEGATVSA